MRIAVLYTGEFRTIEKTIPYLYANILDPNPEAHIFATIQASDTVRCLEILENNIPVYQLKSVQWFEKDEIWMHLRDKMISTINIAEQWKTYLRTSGSMVEYYQLYLSYLKMVEYEEKNGFQYDYVMRFRTDTILNKPLDFSWTRKTPAEIELRMKGIKTLLKDEEITRKHIYYYMNTVFDANRSYYLEDYYSQFIKNEDYHYYKNDPNIQELLSLPEHTFYKKFQEFIQKGNFLISLRKNVIYFVNRKHFHFIPSLGLLYGTFHGHDSFWFNSENQFRYCCMQQKMTIFDSRTELEDKSLYQYEESNYFYKEEIRENSSFLFVLCRK